MVKSIVLVLTMIVLCDAIMNQSVLSATNGNLEGVVKNSHPGEPLPGAHVVLVGTSMGGSTDLDGRYVIRSVPPGTYTIRATYVGYKSVSFSILVPESETLKQNFTLEAVALEGETVVITAQATGQNEAINQQLASSQIVNVVSSARIQELPDANAAESVGRLPGVSVLRSGGEGTQVVIRGLQPKYNAVMVDGVRMASSNPFDRSIDLSMISPYSLEGIEVSKAVTPDLDPDVLGGTVNFKTKSAGGGKGEKEGIGVSLLAQGGYNGLSNAYNKFNNYKYVASVDGRFFESRFGVFAQADWERRNLASNEFGATYTHLGNSVVDYTTTGLNLNNIPRDRQRTNGTLVMDYKLPEGKINLMNFFSSGATEIQNRGEFYDIQNNVHNYSLAYSKSTVNVITNALTVEQQVAIFRANAKLSHTYSETKSPDNWTVRFQQASAGLGQFLNQANLDPRDIPKGGQNDISSAYLGSLVSNNSFSRERALAASLDIEASVLASDMITSVIKFGGKYRYQTRSYVYDQFSGQGLGLQSALFVDNLIASHFPSTAPYVNSTSIPITPFLDAGYSYGKFLDGQYAMASPLNLGMVSEMANFVRSQADLLAQRKDIAYFHDEFNSTTNNYSGQEHQRAAYVMATVNIGPDITFIPGVRYQELQTTYTSPRGIQNTASGVGGPYFHYDTTLTVNHAYWLPAVILRYKPLSWFDVRLAYTNTLAYPDYNAIVPRIDMATGGGIAWNNYQLVPSRSTNYDLYCSFYDNSIGLFTVGAFLKHIDNLIYPWNFYVSGDAAVQYFPPNLGASSSSGTYNVTTFVNDPYRITNWGLEFDWQTHFWYLPHPLDGLVLNANYTHVFSKAQYPYTDVRKVGRVIVYVDTSFTDRLLYQPDDIVNLSLGFDYEGFSIRVSMLYQADIFAGPNFWEQLRTSTSAYTRWDLSVKQTLPWFGFQVYGDLNNINGARDISVVQAQTGVPQSEQSYGLTGDLGIRWQF